ncbi:MAG: hypothetical protein II616_04620 [Bacteroidales bacterium]|nr:hypothetical protein [Bacteroidales bacterium]
MAVLAAVVIDLLELRSVQFVPFGGIVLTVYIDYIIAPVEAIRSQEALLHFKAAALRLLIGADPTIQYHLAHTTWPSFAISSSIWSPARKYRYSLNSFNTSSANVNPFLFNTSLHFSNASMFVFIFSPAGALLARRQTKHTNVF